jgi:uncharacterized caspase-like protein
MSDQFTHGYALLIGVDQNRVSAWALPDVAQDIAALQTVITHLQRCAYPQDNVKTITGQDATRQSILDGLDWLSERIWAAPGADTTAIVYYTGHGYRERRTGASDYYLIPYDIREDQIKSRSLRAADFAEAVNALTPQRLLVILDCCHAGGMGVKGSPLPVGEGSGVRGLPAGYVGAAIPSELLMGAQKSVVGPQQGEKGLQALAQGRGCAVLSSSTGEQSAYIRRDRKMSIFTYHLIEALTGHAQPQEGATEVLVSDVMGHVSRRVPPSARAEWNEEQTPDYQVNGNFPIALLLGGKGLGKGEPAPDPLAPLAAVPSHPTYHATVTGSGSIAQGPRATSAGEGGTAISGDMHGDIIIGDRSKTGRD